MAIEGTVGLAGGGNMGTALLKGMLASGLCRADQVVVAEKLAARAEVVSRECGVICVGTAQEFPELDLLILAVKPPDIPAVAGVAGALLKPGGLVISLAAGVRLKTLIEALPQGTAVVRAMPNTPALVGAGITSLAAPEGQDQAYLNTAREVFGAVGEVVVLAEKLMDAATALAGSGPAYAALIIEAMTDGGVLQGLDRPTAFKLAAHTMIGSARLLIEESLHPGHLKDMVTSPGGTTIAAIHELEARGVRSAFMHAVAAATQRGKELGD